MKALGSIGIDLDGLDCYYDSYGFGSLSSEDYIYTKALPRYLEVFEELGIRVTCFVIGKDLLQPRKRKVVEKFCEAGHEIANHTMHHRFGFSKLARAEKEREIREADKLIAEVTGKKPVGIRFPSLDVDEESISILEDLGYTYDSSILPVSLLWLMKLLYHMNNRGEKTTGGYGRFAFSFAPLRPYFPRPDRIWRKGRNTVLEVPITATPFFRLPFWGTYHMATRFKTFPSDYWMLRRTGLPLNYQLHPIELIDGDEPGLEERARGILGMNIDYRGKAANFKKAISRMKRDYELMTIGEQAEKWRHSSRAGGDLEEDGG